MRSTIEAAIWSSQDEFCWGCQSGVFATDALQNLTRLLSLLLPNFFRQILDSIRTADFIESRAAGS